MLLMVKQCRLAFRLHFFSYSGNVLLERGSMPFRGLLENFIIAQNHVDVRSDLSLIFCFRDLAFSDVKFDIFKKVLFLSLESP